MQSSCPISHLAARWQQLQQDTTIFFHPPFIISNGKCQQCINTCCITLSSAWRWKEDIKAGGEGSWLVFLITAVNKSPKLPAQNCGGLFANLTLGCCVCTITLWLQVRGAAEARQVLCDNPFVDPPWFTFKQMKIWPPIFRVFLRRARLDSKLSWQSHSFSIL